MLYIIATPIGNLEDISARALTALKQSDLILCEDTRRTSILLSRYEISKPLRSFHKFTEAALETALLEDLAGGKHIALVSDAGTPCINDPGSKLTSACIERGIPFTAIPGPCSLIQALVLSGFETSRFQFVGFLPKNPEKFLKSLLFYPDVSIAFESPERLIRTLEILQNLHPLRPIAIAREMTKTFEECRRGAPAELLAHFKSHPPKGEIVLVIGPGEPSEQPLSLEECVLLLQEVHGLCLKEAIKTAAKILKTPKREVYRAFIDRDSDETNRSK